MEAWIAPQRIEGRIDTHPHQIRLSDTVRLLQLADGLVDLAQATRRYGFRRFPETLAGRRRVLENSKWRIVS